MIINELKIIKLFCELDDFSTEFNKKMTEYMLGKNNAQSFNKPEITVSEMMCIEILYHRSGYKCFGELVCRIVQLYFSRQITFCFLMGRHKTHVN